LRKTNGANKGLAKTVLFRYDANMRNPNRQLLTLIKRYELTHADIMELCRCGRTTVHYWTRKPSDPTFQAIKPVYLRLLKLELGEAQRQRKIPE